MWPISHEFWVKEPRHSEPILAEKLHLYGSMRHDSCYQQYDVDGAHVWPKTSSERRSFLTCISLGFCTIFVLYPCHGGVHLVQQFYLSPSSFSGRFKNPHARNLREKQIAAPLPQYSSYTRASHKLPCHATMVGVHPGFLQLLKFRGPPQAQEKLDGHETRKLSPSCGTVCGHYPSPRIAIVFSLPSSLPNASMSHTSNFLISSPPLTHTVSSSCMLQSPTM